MMSTWQEDPELFLYKSHKEGSELHLWKCEKTSSSRPLTRADFSREIPVPDFGCLVRKGCEWRKSCFEALEEYISPRHFLVNCEGLVYVELFKFSEDEKIDDNERIFLRLHDVLNMEDYGFINPKIPFRTVEYIEGGEAATLVDPGPNEQNLTADLIERTFQLKASLKELKKETTDKDALEKQVAGLKAEVTRLENKATTLSAQLDTRTCEVATLKNNLDQEMRNKRILEEKVDHIESKYKILADNEKKLAANLEARSKEVATLKNNLDQEMRNKRILEEKVDIIESKYKILADNEKKLAANLEARSKEVATLQHDLKTEKSQRQELERRVDSLLAIVTAILEKKNPPKGNETKTTSDLDHWTCVVQPLQQDLNQANDNKRTLEDQVNDLESKNRTLTINQTKLKEDLAAKNDKVTALQKDMEKEKRDREALEKKIDKLIAQVKGLLEGATGPDDHDDDKEEEEIEKKEAWMDDYTSDDWVGFEELQVMFERSKPALRITKEGARFSYDNTTNVKADNFCLVFSDKTKYPAKVVDASELTPNGEKARYDPKVWGLMINAGAKYAATYDDERPSVVTCAF